MERVSCFMSDCKYKYEDGYKRKMNLPDEILEFSSRPHDREIYLLEKARCCLVIIRTSFTHNKVMTKAYGNKIWKNKDECEANRIYAGALLPF